MPRPLKPLKEKYFDNSGNEVLREKVDFYNTIGVLDQPSFARYSLFKHNLLNGIGRTFYDKEGNTISREEFEFFYKEGLMNVSSAARYARAKKELSAEASNVDYVD